MVAGQNLRVIYIGEFRCKIVKDSRLAVLALPHSAKATKRLIQGTKVSKTFMALGMALRVSPAATWSWQVTGVSATVARVFFDQNAVTIASVNEP
jgi:hypothetical protein